MSYSIKKNHKIAIKEEVTEGTYQAPTVASDFIQAQEDGIEMNGSKDTLEINVIGQGLSKAAPRVGLESATGSLGVYLKAASNAGESPEYGLMVESLLGSKRSSTAITSGIGNTSSVISVADTSALNVGDIVVVKEAGDYHTSPISEIAEDTSITLLVAADAAFSDNVEIEAFTTYVPADENHPSYSVSKWVENEVLEKAVGCKTTSLSVESFSTGQIASLKMGFEGANFSRSLSSNTITPSYDSSETPIILDACIYQDGNMIKVNDFALSVENSLGWVKDTCNGKVSSRVTDRTISGTINPYKRSDDVSNFTKFDSNTPFSLFITCHNPTGTDGEYGESVSFYLPQCVITELAEGDIDGVLTDQISFSATSEDGSTKELYISMS